MTAPPPKRPSRVAAALAMSLLLASCAPATARELRQSRLASRIAFEADDPPEELLALLDGLAPGCLRGESGVVTQAPGEAAGEWSLTYGFTDFGGFVNTVTIDLTPRPGGRTGVVISYLPHLTDRWKRYAEKTRRWSLRQATDCAF